MKRGPYKQYLKDPLIGKPLTTINSQQKAPYFEEVERVSLLIKMYTQI